jgi:hypothetical protein
MLPSSVEEGMPWPKVMAGVVRPARIPTTPALTSASAPLLFLVLMSPDCSMCIPLAMTLKLTFARSTSEPEATTTFRF